jgi:long-chain-alcohol oxidase
MHRRALRSLTAMAATLLPGSEDLPSAPDSGVPDRFESEVLDGIADARQRRDLRRLLWLLDTRLGGMLLHGRPRRFADMDRPAREAAIRGMARSPLSPIRLGVKALKGTIGMLYMNPPPGHAGEWPPWVVIGYPNPAPVRPRPIAALPIDTLEPGDSRSVDVVVVGSGAGGSTAAAVLARAGLDVAVVEKGGYTDRADFPRHETEALRTLYMDRGMATTADGSITLLAGSTLGGGTVVNYTTAMPTPDSLREEWDRVAGFERAFTGEAFAAAAAAVSERIAVTEAESTPSERDSLMERGLRALGWHVAPLPRNVAGCEASECGNCAMGCRLGAKRSATETWLRDAVAAGAAIVTGAEVDRVLVEGGRAVGARVRLEGGRAEIRARAVVLAAGGLHTPAILVRSRVGGPAAGRHLHLHPATAVWGRFRERVDQWTGMLQTRYSDQFADLDGAGYGLKFETTAVHQSFPPLLFGFEEGATFQADLEAMGHWSLVGILLRDRSSGRVRLDRAGRPRWSYRFDRADLRHLGIGVEKAAAVLAAAGADEIMSSTLRPIRWIPGYDGSALSFADRVRTAGLGANRSVYVSFHQMGSARMGSDPRRAVVGAWNEAHTVPGLFVMDASSFPSASGANPAFTIQAIAHRAATMLAERLA